MKKLVLALAIFSAFTLVSFTNSEASNSETLLNQCTNASAITLTCSLTNGGQDLLFEWNGPNLIHNTSYTHTARLEFLDCNLRKVTYPINNFFGSTSLIIPNGITGVPGASDDCFQYRVRITGGSMGTTQCETVTSYILFP